MLKAGDKAIEFCLQGIDEIGNEGTFCLKELLSTSLILYFYPKDNTSGCSQEAMDFRDNMEIFSSNRIKVVGISPDSLASHKKFKEKFGLNFILLSDPDKAIAKAYGVYGKKKMYGKEVEGIIRSTFLIKPDSIILKAWYNVKAKGHVEGIIKELKAEGFIS